MSCLILFKGRTPGEPEPMHPIEEVENSAPGPGGFPGWLAYRIERHTEMAWRSK
jgi:hypothetical protein